MRTNLICWFSNAALVYFITLALNHIFIYFFVVVVNRTTNQKKPIVHSNHFHTRKKTHFNFNIEFCMSICPSLCSVKILKLKKITNPNKYLMLSWLAIVGVYTEIFIIFLQIHLIFFFLNNFLVY